MMNRIFLFLCILFPAIAFSQFPDAATLKKFRVKKITQTSEGGTLILSYDKEGMETGREDKDYPDLGYTRKIFYNAQKRPDSIQFTFGDKDRTEKVYFRYKPDGSYYRVTLACLAFGKDVYCSKDSAFFNPSGNIQWEIAEKRGRTTYEYDAKGKLVKEVNQKSGTVTEYMYNTAGKVDRCKATSKDGNSTTTYFYGTNNLLVKEVFKNDMVDLTIQYSYEYY